MQPVNHGAALDLTRIQHVLTSVADELTEHFPDLPSTDIGAVVTQVVIEFVSAAHLADELKILVRRRAMARLLATHPNPTHTAYR